MSYPEFAHLGFKTICATWMLSNYLYMDVQVKQRNAQIKLLDQINNNLTVYNNKSPKPTTTTP